MKLRYKDAACIGNWKIPWKLLQCNVGQSILIPASQLNKNVYQFNDGLALLALNYLRRNEVDVPGAISVAGFDNTIHSFVRGLTSYDFNMPGIVRALLEHVLMPMRFAPTSSGDPCSIGGAVVARASTGPVGKCLQL